MKGRASRLAGRDEVFQSAFPAQNKQTKKNKTIKMVCLFFLLRQRRICISFASNRKHTDTALALSSSRHFGRRERPTPPTSNSVPYTWFYWLFTGFYWIIPGFTGFYWVLPSFTGFDKILLISLAFTGSNWVLQGCERLVTGFLPSFTGFYRVATARFKERPQTGATALERARTVRRGGHGPATCK